MASITYDTELLWPLLCCIPLNVPKKERKEGRKAKSTCRLALLRMLVKNYQIATHSALVSQTVSPLTRPVSVCLIGAFLQFLATRKEERSVPSAKEGVLPNGGGEGIGPHPTLNSARRAGRGRLRTGSNELT